VIDCDYNDDDIMNDSTFMGIYSTSDNNDDINNNSGNDDDWEWITILCVIHDIINYYDE
jgi:hypothetical protein